MARDGQRLRDAMDDLTLVQQDLAGARADYHLARKALDDIEHVVEAMQFLDSPEYPGKARLFWRLIHNACARAHEQRFGAATPIDEATRARRAEEDFRWDL